MKGGAYGAFAQSDNLEGPFSFSTYRDPNPLRSLDAFSSILKEASTESAIRGGRSRKKADLDRDALDKDALDKAVIGAFARETRPRSPTEKSLADFLRFLYGIEDRHRRMRLQGIIEVTEDKISAVEKRLASEMGGQEYARAGERRGFPVIITGKAEAEKAAEKLGVEVRELPV